MHVKELLSALGAIHIKLKEKEGNIDVVIPKGVTIPAELLSGIRAHKAEILQLIKAASPDFEHIPLAPEQDSYAVSSAQKRVWMLSQLEEGSVAYNIPVAYHFSGNLQLDVLTDTVNTIMARHESLRTVFRQDEQGEVRQFILPVSSCRFEPVFEHMQEQHAGALGQKMEAELLRPFDLENGPLLRANVYQTAAAEYIVLFAMHHIVGDAWSFEVFVQELLALYNSSLQQWPNPLPPLRIQYKDYAAWQHRQMAGPAFRAQEKYWLDQFKGPLPVLELPGQHNRPAIKTFNGEVVQLTVDRATFSNLKQFLEQRNGTLFMGLLAALNALVYRYAGQEDVIIGTPIAGREHPDLETQIGFFVNTLALRTCFSAADDFAALFERTKQTALGAFANQLYPFDQLVDALNLPRDLSRSPLFDLMLVLQNVDLSRSGNTAVALDGLTVQPYASDGKTSKFDLTFNFFEEAEELRLVLELNSDIYTPAFAAQLCRHWQNILREALAQPQTPIAELKYLDSEEENLLLHTFGQTGATAMPDQSVVHHWERQLEKTPNHTALVYQDTQLSYRELDILANQLAHFLIERYAPGEETFVGIALKRSDWMMVALLAVLKCRCAYLPIDMDYPEERIRFILDDSHCEILIDQDTIAAFLIQKDRYTLEAPAAKPMARQLAYALYTSGTTGHPKGALIEHKSIVRLVKSPDFINLTDDLVLLVTGSPSFDSVTFEYWSMLLNGGRLVLADTEELLDVERLKVLIRQHGVNTMWLTASWFNEILDEDYSVFTGLKTLLVGGDKLSFRHINLLQEASPEIQLINGYGPTENTTFSLCHPIRERYHADIPIGKPIRGSSVLLLDQRQQLVPVGVPGEIYVGGAGLARGYLNRPDLTREKFVDHPYQTGERLFRTGDIGLWRPDGTVHFMGRKDDQVKIRGFRIEPGEIRNTLLAHPAVQNAAVTTFLHGTEKKIAAYWVGTAGQAIETDALYAYLKTKLPAYMLPEALIELPVLPLTPNGKVDMRALPAPVPETNAPGYFVAPVLEQEIQVAEIWSDILGKTPIGLYDNFFDLGGHSLKLIRLISKYQQAFGVKLAVRDLFTHTTIPEHLRLLKTWAPQNLIPIEATETRTHYPLSSSQRRLWILSQFDAASVAYNIPVAFLFEGPLDAGCLQKSFGALIDRHESLRTVFQTDANGEVHQLILPPEANRFQLEVSEIANTPDAASFVEAALQQEMSTPFDLKNGPLLRGCLYRLTPHKHLLVFTIHHIISDAWSIEIIRREILSLYSSFQNGFPNPMPPLRIQFKEYAAWQLRQLEGDALAGHQHYWLDKLKGELPVLELPLRQARPALKTFNGASVFYAFQEQTIRSLRAFARSEGGTLFMGLLSAIDALLFRYTNQDDIIVGSPIAGREHPDLENQVGFFVNTLPLRVRFNGTDSFKTLFGNVRAVLLDAYEHQIYPFDQLVEDLDLARDMSRSPLFDVMVALENVDLGAAGTRDQEFSGLQVSALGSRSATSKFDLTFNFFENNDGVELELEYNTDLFADYFIQQLCKHLEQLLQHALANPQLAVSHIDYLDAEEQEALIGTNLGLQAQYPRESTLVSLFSEQVRRTPGGVAVKDEQESLSYDQLDTLSNQLAHFLIRKYGLALEALVAIELEKSNWMIVAMLAVLKSGGAYVPIDPDYPEDRKAFMKTDSQCKAIVNAAELDRFLACRDTLPTDCPQVAVQPQHLAYVIYTSGSTGRPKGCLIEHENVVRLFKTDQDKFGFHERDVWVMFHSFCFDFSVWEIFGALLFGGKLIVPSKLAVKDPKRIFELILSEGVTVFNQTPSSFYNCIDYLKSTGAPEYMPIRYVIFGGEALQPKKLSYWWEQFRASKLINMYGITETTVHVTYKEIGEAEIRSNKNAIGKAIPTLSTVILDQNLRLVPKGIPGEICVGGKGLARGYLNRPELTAQRFPAHPYAEGQRLYRSGDKAILLENGELEYLGRLDDQVKIRGYRIELGEIEEVLLQYEGVKEVIVLPYAAGSDNYELAAFLVVQQELPFERLRAFAAARLPQYMVPARFLRIEKIPLTQNGKTDKKRLLAMPGSELAHETPVVAPVNATEAQLLLVWAAVLGKTTISTDANFFHIGGDSIKALRLLSEINKNFRTELGIPELYTHPSIAGLAGVIADNVHLPAAEHSRWQLHFDRLAAELIDSGMVQASQIEAVFPMSDIETGMVFTSMASGDLAIYHDQMVFETAHPNLNLDAFRQALALLTRKHPILRTALFVDRFSEPLQVVLKEAEAEVRVHQLAGKTDAEVRMLIDAYLATQRKQPFVFEAAPLWRVALFLLDQHTQVIVLECHHAILDGWSVASLITELNNLYVTLIEQPAFVPAPLALSYKDYVVQELRHKKDERALRFWENELDGYKRLDIFSERPCAVEVQRNLDTNMPDQVLAAARRMGVPEQVVYFSAFLYTLGLLDAGKDITAGLVTNNRPVGQDADAILGCFLNSVPFRIQLPKGGSWSSFVQAVHEKHRQHKNHPLTLFELNRQINGGKNDGNPFFDVLFNFVDFYVYNDLNVPQNGQPNPEAGLVEALGFGRANTLLDCTINKTEHATQVQLGLWQELSSGISLDTFADWYLRVLAQLLAETDRIEYYPILGEEYLPNINLAETGQPSGQLLDFFTEQVAVRPDQAAISFGRQTMSYQEAEARANQLAHCLQAAFGVGEGDRVGICLERSDWLIITVLGVLKSGSAFVPVDVQYPEERMRYIREDAGCTVFIDQEKLQQLQALLPQYPTEAPMLANRPDRLAYVIYTSGSTGLPKGVLVPHQGVCNTIRGAMAAIQPAGQERHLQFASPSFDAFVWEVFLAFGSGGTVVVLDEAAKLDARLLGDFLLEQQVTVATLTPSFLRNFDMRLFEPLNILITAGEAADAAQLRAFARHGQAYNAYGPTELSICATMYRFDTAKDSGISRVPIGQPLPNTGIILLDEYGQLLPYGVPGEIAASGAGLARGYLNRPELTAEKFIPHPVYSNEKVYLTGDLGRWLPDGNLEYVGRKDEQVKIRGYRIEPGEIEQVLQQHPGVQNAVVLVVEQAGKEPALAAAVVLSDPGILSGITAFLKQQLPGYMVPSRLLPLQELPLTHTGKLDKRKLLALLSEGPSAAGAVVAPRTPLEHAVAAIWSEILGLDTLGVSDDFMLLGGHSLSLIRLASRYEQRWNLRPSIADLYTYTTLEQHAQLISRLQGISTATHAPLLVALSPPDPALDTMILLPPVFGDANMFRAFAGQVQDTYACYGLNYEDGDTPATSMEQLVARQAAAVGELNLPKHKPVTVLGYSMGASLAFELVKTLEAEGYWCFLILVDRPPNTLDNKGVLEMYSSEEIDSYVAELLATVYGMTPGGRESLFWQQQIKHHAVLLDAHLTQGTVQADVLSIEGTDQTFTDKMSAWENYTQGRHQLLHVPVEHYDFFQAKNLLTLKNIVYDQRAALRHAIDQNSYILGAGN